MFHLERGTPQQTHLSYCTGSSVGKSQRQFFGAYTVRYILPPTHQAALYWAAFTLAFYAFLRVTSRTRTKAPKQSHPSGLDHYHKSKTSQYRSPPPIFIAATNTNTCPVAALQQHIISRSFSKMEHSSALTPHSRGYSSHSFRIGAAKPCQTRPKVPLSVP